MVRNQHRLGSLHVHEARRLRSEADELLQRLLDNRNASERRHAEAGWRDAMKYITGRSALEEAICTTRDMITHMDALLSDLNEVVQAEEDCAVLSCEQPIAIGSESSHHCGSST